MIVILASEEKMESCVLGYAVRTKNRTMHQLLSFQATACNMAYLPAHSMPTLLVPCLLCTIVHGKLFDSAS